MSFDIFLLEKGSKLSLITQEFVLRPQPSFTITHTTQLFISLTITKISDDNCQRITTPQQMECYINKLRMRIIEEEDISCLPPQIYNIFYESDLDLPLCQNNTNSAMSAYMVISNLKLMHNKNIIAKTFFSGYIGCYRTTTRYRLPQNV